MTKPTAMKRLFQGIQADAALQGQLIGRLDSAAVILEPVLQEARENLARNPRHKLTGEAVKLLERTMADLADLSEMLSREVIRND